MQLGSNKLKRIYPYKNLEEALKDLDNGGGFFNFFTEAGDGLITDSEFKKASGQMSFDNETVLDFSLRISQLCDDETAEIQSRFSKNLKGQMNFRWPQIYNHQNLQEMKRFKEALVQGVIEKSEGDVYKYGTISVHKTGLNSTIFHDSSYGKLSANTIVVQEPIRQHFNVLTIKKTNNDKGELLVLIPKTGAKFCEGEKVLLGGCFRVLDIAGTKFDYFLPSHFTRLETNANSSH